MIYQSEEDGALNIFVYFKIQVPLPLFFILSLSNTFKAWDYQGWGVNGSGQRLAGNPCPIFF